MIHNNTTLDLKKINNCYVNFLNHSSVILSSKEVRILCDPWFKGSAFNGWSLLHDQSHDINSLSYDYIWISHEHPDHFSIPTLSQLNSSKTFLYQETKDKKVKHYLEKKGHKVIELPNKKTIRLKDLLITCVTCDGYDSTLIAKFPNDKVVININDARVNLDDDYLKNEIMPILQGEDVDLLMCQSSYANWAGNKGDVLIPRHQQEMVDKKNIHAMEILRPKAIMLFASFIYYSHEENFYWNDISWFDHTFELFSKKKSQVIIPLPDQIIALDNIISNDLEEKNKIAKDFWNKALKNIKIITKSNVLSLENLKSDYEKFIKNLHEKNTLISKLDTDKNFIITLMINDLGLNISIGLLKNHFVVEERVSRYCAKVSSETFSFLMNNPFGRGTITINSRAEFDYDYAHQFFLFFFINYANNIGKYFDEFSKISYELLCSINRTSVMSSILVYNENAKQNLHSDAILLSNLFSKVVHSDEDLNKFNDEPPNSKLG